MKIAVSRFNKTIEFGSAKSVENNNAGDYDTKFFPEYTLHYALYQRTQLQQYQLLGTEFDDTITIAVRRNPQIIKGTKAHFTSDADDIIYTVISNSMDSTGLPVGYDLIMLKKVAKVG